MTPASISTGIARAPRGVRLAEDARRVLAANSRGARSTDADALASREVCGVLLGTRRGARIVVESAVELANLSRGCERFELDPADIVRAERDGRRRGLDLVGFWHTHPRGPARLSAADRSGAWPRTLQVVIAGDGAVGASWIDDQENASELEVTA